MFSGNKIAAVNFGNGLPSHFPLRCGFQWIFRRKDLGDLLSFNQFRIAGGMMALGIEDSTICSGKICGIGVPLLCRQSNQRITRRGGYAAKLQVHYRRSAAAEGAHVKGHQLRVSHDQANRCQRHR